MKHPQKDQALWLSVSLSQCEHQSRFTLHLSNLWPDHSLHGLHTCEQGHPGHLLRWGACFFPFLSLGDDIILCRLHFLYKKILLSIYPQALSWALGIHWWKNIHRLHIWRVVESIQANSCVSASMPWVSINVCTMCYGAWLHEMAWEIR